MRGAKPARALVLALERTRSLRDGESIAVACSGGPDSVALAGALRAAAFKRGWKLALAHVNHGLRASAYQDEAVVLRVGAALGLPVRVLAIQSKRRDEATLRAARYSALEAAALEAGAGVVATAHTAEDQAETVLLALFRGTGRDGLGGMAVRRPLNTRIDLCRPLLRWHHAALLRYCHTQALPYVVDPTNADVRYRRNAVRAALEHLRPSFPGLDRAVARAAEVLADESAGSGHAILRRRVRDVLRHSGGLDDVGFEQVESAVRALEGASSGEFFMSPKIRLEIARDTLAVKRRP